MCLVKLQRFPKRAKEDIKCYKVLAVVNADDVTMYYSSPVYYEKYTFENNKCEKKSKFKLFEILFSNTISKGIHTFNTKKNNIHYALIQYDAIIPKGTLYYVGRDNDLVSERLIVYENHTT